MKAGEDPDPGPSRTTLAELGERGLIARLRGRLPPPGPDILVGIGDDAAAVAWGGETLLLTTDTLLEGVHFRRSTATLRDIGAKAIAVNVSDIAAMGGEPRLALLALALPPTLAVADVDELYAGLLDMAQQHGVTLVGGDTCAAPGGVVLSVTLVGRVTGAPLRRSGARPGDAILVTGDARGIGGGPGRARAGAGRIAAGRRRGGRAPAPDPDAPRRREPAHPGSGRGDGDDRSLGRARDGPRAHRDREPGGRPDRCRRPPGERGDPRGGRGPSTSTPCAGR